MPTAENHLMQTSSVLTSIAARNAIELAKAYIEDNLTTDIRLEDIAKEAGISPYHFCRSFKVATGYSPYQYVLRRRVLRAQTLLEGGTLSLAEIAYTLGFCSQGHLSQVFKKQLGITPGTYRKKSYLKALQS